MPDPMDVYSDQFQVNLGPYGITLNFFLTIAIPPGAPGSAPQAERVASVRTSLEHAKIMAFLLHRQIMDYESQTGVRIMLPADLLNELGIGPEDWDAFWKE